MNRRVLWLIVAVCALLAMTATVAWAAPLGQDGTGTEADVLWTTLAPLVAIATFIERILEMFWARYEKAAAWPNKAGVSNTADPDYIVTKKGWSHWLGTLLAIVAIALSNYRLFRLLGFDVLFSGTELFHAGIGGIFDHFTIGTLVDWLMTAGIIGWGGTEFTHNIIEGLVKGRNLWKELREVEAGRMAITDARFFSDYVAPRLQEHGISVEAVRQVFTTLHQVGVSPDRLITSMTVGKVDELLGDLSAQAETAAAAQTVRNLLEGMPAEQMAQIPNVVGLLTPDQRQRFLGA